MNTSRYIQDLEDVYCNNRSAVTSAGLSCGSATLPTRIINGGKKVLYAAAMTGMLLNNTIPAYADLVVNPEETSIGLTVGIDPFNSVVSTLNNYGNTHSTVINSGGTENVYDGGVSLWATVNVSGVQNIYAGGGANVTTVSGGQQYVNSGAVAINTYVDSAFIPIGYGSTVRGEQFVLSGGLTSNATITEGSQQYIYDGGSALDTTVNNYAIQHISAGGYASGTQINSGYQEVYSGGSAASTVVNDGGEQRVHGRADMAVVNSGGSQVITTGGTALNTSVHNQGAQYVVGGGQAISTFVKSGGLQEIYNSGLAISSIICGSQIVKGSAVSTVLSAGFLEASGGVQYISYGGLATSTTVDKGATQYVGYSGQANSTTVYSSGTQEILLGGSASNTVVNLGGQQIISGGVAVDTRVVGSQYISAGVASNTNLSGYQTIVNGRANNTSVNGGIQSIRNTGSAINTVISSAGKQYISNGGKAFSTFINSGSQYISNGGSAISTVINRGAQYISNGGKATSTNIHNSGVQNILNGGSAIETSITSGGIQNISNGGSALETTISSGGIQNISNGGQTSITTILEGTQNILSGGAASNVTNNGIVNLYANGALHNYNGSGILYVYADNNLTGATDLDGRIVFMSSAAPTVLSLENLSANSATISMNVDLENQTADQLQITSSFDGNAQLVLRNTADVANATSGEGIKLVDISNTATVNGTFELAGGKWDEGGYVYSLLQDEGDPDYYLRTTGSFTDTFKTMANIPMVNAAVAKTGMNSLNKRMGDLRDMNNPAKKQGVWVRTYYKDMTVKDLLKTDMSLFGVEAGYDWLFRADEPTKLYAGVMVGYMRADSIKTKNTTDDTNTGKGDAPSVGLYATLANESGWFIDLAARNFWSKIENTTHTSLDTNLKFDSNRNLITASLEVGKTVNLDKDFKIEPKVEVSYMNANAKTTEVIGGVGNLEYDAENYLSGKAAVMFSYKMEMQNKKLIEPLLELAYNYEFDGKGKISYGGAETETTLKGGSFEVAAGLSMQIADNLYWHALGSYEAGNKLSGWGLNAGVRLGFGGKGTKTVK